MTTPLLVGELISVRSLNNLLRAMNTKNVRDLEKGETRTLLLTRVI